MDIAKKVAEAYESVVAFRRAVHEHPEIAMKEFETTKKIIAELKKIPNIEIQDCNPGVIAILRGKYPGKTIALRGDIDALPSQEKTGLPFASKIDGMCHSCGHDMHGAIVLGCAKVLSAMTDELHGNVKFFFQPAEETLEGARHLIKNGCMENPKVDAVVGMHTWPNAPVGSIALKRGPMMAAADIVRITIKGQEGHAARPHLSTDPVFISAQVITAMQSIVARQTNAFDTAVVGISTIHAGTVPNTIPGEVKMSGTVRSFNPEVRKNIPEQMKRIVTNVPAAFGGEGILDYEFGTPSIINDEAMVDLIEEAGIQILGKENVRAIELPVTGGEDFAFYMEHAPGIFFRVGIINDDPRSRLIAHNPELVFDEKALEVGMKVGCQAVLNYLK